MKLSAFRVIKAEREREKKESSAEESCMVLPTI